MKLKIYGDAATGYFLSTEDGDNRNNRPHLDSCPFCHEANGLTLTNTHTPCFWVECECGAQMHGPSITYTEQDLKTKAGARRVYGEAVEVAANAWNERTPASWRRKHL